MDELKNTLDELQNLLLQKHKIPTEKELQIPSLERLNKYYKVLTREQEVEKFNDFNFSTDTVIVPEKEIKFEDIPEIRILYEKARHFEIYSEYYNNLVRLKLKEIPKKPAKHSNNIYRCRNCDELFQNHHYQNCCPNCGQRLNWDNLK